MPSDESHRPVLEAIKQVYKQKILPLEQQYRFDDFHSPHLTDTDFEAKPMVLLVGQYSVGKTSFIRYLVERDFPGVRIGPEPTTDRFTAVMWGQDERTMPGNALAADADKPFTALNKFGMSFLNRFEGSFCPSPLLEKITFVDTPGVLSGEKQRVDRGYDFPQVIEWFAERADRILLLFDAHKLDISDEFKTAIEALRGQDEKIRVVLNKADMKPQKLMRVYGALMWSLGKVIQTPEVLRVYVGSFWEGALQNTENRELIEDEMRDLVADLRSLPRNAASRKVNELIKRARTCFVHTHIVTHLRNQFGWFGTTSTQNKLLSGLLEEFKKVQNIHSLPKGDFPNVKRFRETLCRYKINKFPALKPRQLQLIEEAWKVDIPRLMKLLPSDTERFDSAHEVREKNPFEVHPDETAPDEAWVISTGTKTEYDNQFYALPLNASGKASGAVCRDVMIGSGASTEQLRQVWELADIDQDGCLDADEFAVAMYLLGEVKRGSEVPAELSMQLIPPSKRCFFEKEYS
eukprot:CAMPEP_0175090376 /NCGR_PEP_ID=MMETSP0086_2-20121207/1307_1 /TAXON_ID=136419 /ORGANISM="Unknown Unknown, Strain D1" /LENGTH=518 /DNA_ID=CAMNT_0016362989 /DNA_START=60 /DNA_END=1616 /DNA_ORIENTATION=-